MIDKKFKEAVDRYITREAPECVCIRCNRFVSEINNDGFCLECEEEEKWYQ